MYHNLGFVIHWAILYTNRPSNRLAHFEDLPFFFLGSSSSGTNSASSSSGSSSSSSDSSSSSSSLADAFWVCLRVRLAGTVASVSSSSSPPSEPSSSFLLPFLAPPDFFPPLAACAFVGGADLPFAEPFRPFELASSSSLSALSSSSSSSSPSSSSFLPDFLPPLAAWLFEGASDLPPLFLAEADFSSSSPSLSSSLSSLSSPPSAAESFSTPTSS